MRMITERVVVLMSAEMVRRLGARAREEEVSVGALVRRAVDWYLGGGMDKVDAGGIYYEPRSVPLAPVATTGVLDVRTDALPLGDPRRPYGQSGTTNTGVSLGQVLQPSAPTEDIFDVHIGVGGVEGRGLEYDAEFSQEAGRRGRKAVEKMGYEKP